jgi:hypothetical protein
MAGRSACRSGPHGLDTRCLLGDGGNEVFERYRDTGCVVSPRGLFLPVGLDTHNRSGKAEDEEKETSGHRV